MPASKLLAKHSRNLTNGGMLWIARVVFSQAKGALRIVADMKRDTHGRPKRVFPIQTNAGEGVGASLKAVGLLLNKHLVKGSRET